MNFNEIEKLDSEYVMHTYTRNPVAIDHGHGATVYDTEGRSYVDFTSGIGVMSLGYGNKDVAKAVYEQALKLTHMSNLYYTEPCVRLAEQLCKRAGMKYVFFGNSGAEANEGMIKTARKYSFDRYGKGRSTVITLKQSFHGRTITTLKATGQEHFHDFFYPFTDGFEYATPGDIGEIKGLIKNGDVCAVMIELIQGEGGVFVLPQDYVRELRKLCDENDILLLIDEVQTGIGRTGALFAYQMYGIKPDICSFAKGIAAGLPMGGFLVNDKCADVMGYGDHGSTFGGNPLSSVAALCVLSALDDEFLNQVSEKGQYIREKISSFNSACVKDVRGDGLMAGIELCGASNACVAKEARENGLLCLTAGANVVRLLPPLVISYDEIDKGLKILKKVFEILMNKT